MAYLKWALLALASYTMVAPLMKIGTRDIPADVGVVVANGVLIVFAGAIVVASEETLVPYLTHPGSPYLYAAGVFLAVGIISYYRALAMGPVSVVVPIFGLFIVTSSLAGAVLLDEPFTAKKALGIVFAVLALYFTAT